MSVGTRSALKRVVPEGIEAGVIIRTGSSLVGSMVVTSLLGFVYWWLAAREFEPSAVGFAAAAVSAMMLLASLAMMGLATLLLRELPRHPGHEMALIATTVLVTSTLGAGFGATFSVVAPIISQDLAPVAANPLTIIVFSVGVGLSASVVVMDYGLVGLLRSDLQLSRNIVFAVSKLIALFMASLLFEDRSGMLIFAAWISGDAVSLAFLAGYSQMKGRLTRAFPLQFGLVFSKARSAAMHHLLNLALQAPGWILPVAVTAIISAAVNASFYVAWMIAGVAFFVPMALGYALYSVGSRTPQLVGRYVRLTVTLGVLSGIGSYLVVALVGPTVLGLYGKAYLAPAETALLILPLAVFPLIVKSTYVTIHRIRDRLGSAAVIVAAGAALEIVLPIIGAFNWGLTGLSIGLLAALVLEASAMVPTVYRAMQGLDVDEQAVR